MSQAEASEQGVRSLADRPDDRGLALAAITCAHTPDVQYSEAYEIHERAGGDFVLRQRCDIQCRGGEHDHRTLELALAAVPAGARVELVKASRR